jgi:hypothetical protein
MSSMQSKNDPSKNGNKGRAHVPRRWSSNPFSRTGPVARLFGMERQARKLAAEGIRFKGTGNLQSAFIKFQLAASSEKNLRFAADLHEMAADTMFEIAGTSIEQSKKDSCFLAAGEEFRCAAAKLAKVDKEKAAKLYIRAGNCCAHVNAHAFAKNDFQVALTLTSKRTLCNWLRAQVDALE